MNPGDLAALAPLLIIAGTAVAVMLAASVRRHHGLAASLTLAGLAAGMIALIVAWPLAPRQITPLLLIDRYALFYIGLIIAATFAVVMFSYEYLAKQANTRREEYYLLLLLAATGSATLVSSVHFASFFLGLELLSVSLYALVAYPRANVLSAEAGVKYLILAGASSAFVLFGMALVYAALGTLEFAPLAALAGGASAGGHLIMAGVGLIVVGIAFKLSLAPFHFWAPDVYQGAPAPVTAFVATVSKGAVFALLLRFVTPLAMQRHAALAAVFTLLALVSMFVGNWLALLQNNVKRLLAYSSIAHMGYLLVALLAGGAWAPVAVTYYLAAYFATTLGAFGIVALLSSAERDADTLEDYLGLAWRRPWLAGVFTVMLLSLAGIPVTAGFIGKFYVLATGVKSGLWLLVGALVINSAIGLFYYLRVIVTLYRPLTTLADDHPAPTYGGLHALGGVALLILTAALLWLGLYPAPTLRLIQAVVGE